MQSIKIGTRQSELALWQANKISQQLQAQGYPTEIIKISSKGDLELTQAIYKMGIVGVFTKTLDAALLRKEIDIAVHSMKDVPTFLPKGIAQFAVSERATVSDVLVKGNQNIQQNHAILLTGSLRRKAQWLQKYPQHQIHNLRGNVNLRLEKIKQQDCIGGIFAQAGLERINLLPKDVEILDWILPAPAQGAIMVAGLSENEKIKTICQSINHQATQICTHIERQFMQTLESGCSAPIGALAQFKNKNTILFKGAVFAINGKKQFKIEKEIAVNETENAGKQIAQELLAQGADQLIIEIKKQMEA